MNRVANALTIRTLRAEDKSQWADMWRDYLAFYETALPDDVYETTFSRLLGDDPQDFSCFVAEQNGALVGLTHYLFHRHAWKVEKVCYLQGILMIKIACRFIS